MNDEKAGLIARALAKLSGDDPVRDGLAQLVAEHGRESVAKAASDLGIEPELSAEEQAEVNAALEELNATGESGEEAADPVSARLDKIEQAIEKLANGNGAEGEAEGDALPQDELELVKSGVPVDQIEAAQPMLRSEDEQARNAAFAFLAKQASPQRKALLAKEAGSSGIPAEEAEKERMKAQLAKADGEDPDRKPAVEAALEILRRAG